MGTGQNLPKLSVFRVASVARPSWLALPLVHWHSSFLPQPSLTFLRPREEDEVVVEVDEDEVAGRLELAMLRHLMLDTLLLLSMVLDSLCTEKQVMLCPHMQLEMMP